MKTVVIIVGVLLALWVLRWTYIQLPGSHAFEYRGHIIRMSRKYVDYDAYKNDADNILESELPKLERLIADAKIGPSFQDWSAFTKQAFELAVPGYGFGGGPKIVSSERELLVSSVEIPSRPPAERFRFFVLEKLSDGSLRLVDDFIDRGYPHLAEVHAEDGRLVYFDKDHAEVRETRL